MNGRFIYYIAKLFTEEDSNYPACRLATSLAGIALFDAWSVYLFEEDKEPSVLEFLDLRPVRDGYCKKYYRDDPFYQLAKDGCSTGFYKISDIAPDNFSKSDYFAHYLAGESGCSDQIGYIYNVDSERTLVLTMTRSAKYKAFRACELEDYELVTPLVTAALDVVMAKKGLNRERTREAKEATTQQNLMALENFAATALSPREHEIVRLLISGASSKVIGMNLQIATGTVQNHIKHIYQKLGISSRGELFGRFVDELLSKKVA